MRPRGRLARLRVRKRPLALPSLTCEDTRESRGAVVEGFFRSSRVPFPVPAVRSAVRPRSGGPVIPSPPSPSSPASPPDHQHHLLQTATSGIKGGFQDECFLAQGAELL